MKRRSFLSTGIASFAALGVSPAASPAISKSVSRRCYSPCHGKFPYPGFPVELIGSQTSQIYSIGGIDFRFFAAAYWSETSDSHKAFANSLQLSGGINPSTGVQAEVWNYRRTAATDGEFYVFGYAFRDRAKWGEM